MTWLTHLRTIAVAASAFTLCCGLVTQMLARALGYASELGPRLVDLSGLRLYGPFSFLGWTLKWAQAAPSLLVLALCLVFVCALAAYAVAIVIAKLEPIALAEPSPWRDLASWDELGDYGLLRDEGLALGAVRRHAMAPYRVVRGATGGCLFLGQPRHTDDALRTALASWQGALILIEARSEIADAIGRADVWRFAPGRPDTLSINPLLSLRGGLDAWADARRLASALLSGDRATEDAGIDAFALLMLDQLMCAPIPARTLTALRRRLLDPVALVAELCARWVLTPTDGAAPAIWEMVYVARALRAEPDDAIAQYGLIDRALAGFADAGITRATRAHRLSLAQFVSASPPRALVLSMQGIVSAKYVAPLFYGLLAQLAALRANAGAAHDLLVAVEVEAARMLVDDGQVRRPLPASAGTRVVIQAADVAHAERLSRSLRPLGPVVAVGPQTDSNAAALSRLGGRCMTYEPVPHRIPRWRRLLFPSWAPRAVERLPEAALKAARADEAFLVAQYQKPVRLNVLLSGGATTYLNVRELAAHDWSAPPLAAVALTQDPPSVVLPPTPPGATSAKLRRVLMRKSATPSNKGAPHP